MSLQQNRYYLELYLDKLTVEELTEDWTWASGIINNWWKAFKEWEARDTFEAAFRENRMTFRESKFGTKKIWPAMQAYKPGDKKKSEFSGHTLDVGLTGFNKRMDPENFLPDVGGDSKKYELGLHDLSASLLNPGKAISSQTYTSLPDKQYVIFMPLSDQRDQVVFQWLNIFAKRVGKKHAEFYNLIRTIRSQMSRIKLAYEWDMSSSFVALTPEAEKPKFRYMPGRTHKVKGNIFGRKTTEAHIERFKDNAIDYRGLINKMIEGGHGYNEIIVAYRQHANKSFPMYAKWNLAAKQFDLIAVSETKGVVTEKSLGTSIPDVAV